MGKHLTFDITGNKEMLRFLGLIIGMCIIGAHLGSPFSAIAQTPPGEDRASAQDCAVIAAAGEDQLKWRERSPSLPMLADSYGVNCNWNALGVKRFEISGSSSGAYSESRFSFSKPEYSADGKQAELDYAIGGRSWPHPQFYALYSCIVKRAGKGWRSTSCRLKLIT